MTLVNELKTKNQTMLRTKLQTALITLLCATFVLLSCSDDPSSVQEQPPELPPASSMEMDFSTFNDQSSKSQSEVQTIENFSRAVGTALVMKTVVDVNLLIPRVLLAAASEADPQFNEDGEWIWEYSKTVNGNDFGVRLVATETAEDSLSWNTYVTNSQLGVDNRLFFSGTTNGQGTSGEWTYYSLRSPEAEQEVSRLDWTVNGEDDVELRLEVLTDRNGYAGDYIDYSFDGTTKTATYYDSSDDEITEIQINIQTNVGYFLSPDYNNGEKACWDENFQDIACSEL